MMIDNRICASQNIKKLNKSKICKKLSSVVISPVLQGSLCSVKSEAKFLGINKTGAGNSLSLIGAEQIKSESFRHFQLNMVNSQTC